MQTSYLQEFVTLSKLLSFSSTARRFYISQSALSRHISALEEELGVSLFDRDSRSVALTEAGKMFAHDAQVVLNDLDHAMENVGILKESGQISVHIGYLHEPFYGILDQIYTRFMTRAPDMRTQFHTLDYGALHDSLAERRSDVALITYNDPELGELFELKPVGQDHYVLATPFDHPLAKCASVTIDQLEGVNMVYPDPVTMYPFYRTAESWFAQAGFEPKVAATYYDIPSMFFHVSAGDGVALVLNCSRYFHKRCVFVPILGIDPSIPLVAAWRRDLSQTLRQQLTKVFDGFCS